MMLQPGPELAREVAALARKDGLALFLGAGINGTAGWMWKDLLEQLLRRALVTSLAPVGEAAARDELVAALACEHDCYSQASIAAVLLGSNRFAPILRNAVYSRLNGTCGLADLEKFCAAAAREPFAPVSQLQPARMRKAFGYLAAVARLCMRPEVTVAVTYNFDTLLEHAMTGLSRAAGCARWMNRAPVSVARQIECRQPAAGSGRLVVYHVHGCLPPPGALVHVGDEPVVMAQQDYARTMQNPYDWESSSQLHYLRHSPCLFLGLSMNDWNVLRLLQSAGPGPVTRQRERRLFCVGSSPDELQGELKARLLGSFGVSYHPVIGRRFQQLQSFVDELCVQLCGKEYS